MSEEFSKAAFIGDCVLESQKRQAEYAKQMGKVWREEGTKLKNARLSAKVSQKELSKSMNVDVSVVKRLEQGKLIKRRRAIKASYQNTLELIMYKRFAQVQRL